jgi:hypothetical protein
MKAKMVLCVAMFLMVCLLELPADADVVILQRVSGWTAFGGRSDTGSKLCGVSARGGGRYFSIKYFENDDHLTVHLSKDTWKVRNGLHIDLTMQFDNESPWSARATTFHMNDSDAALQFTIGSQQMRQWIREFRGSAVLYIRFPNSDVEDWQADLSGTPQIADTMSQCLWAMSASQ